MIEVKEIEHLTVDFCSSVGYNGINGRHHQPGGPVIMKISKKKQQSFANEFQRRFTERMGDFGAVVMCHNTPEEREKAFHAWIRKNPERLRF